MTRLRTKTNKTENAETQTARDSRNKKYTSSCTAISKCHYSLFHRLDVFLYCDVDVNGLPGWTIEWP